MADTQLRRGHVVSRVDVGIVYVVAGLLVLLVQVEDLALQWSILAPTVIVVLGLGLLVTGIVDTHLHRDERDWRRTSEGGPS